MNENHLTFTSKGDMQAMRQQKATTHELGSIVKFKVSQHAFMKFAFYSRVQLPSSGDNVINPIQARGL